MIQTVTPNQGIVCMSVQCVHGTQGEPVNEAMSTAYLHFDVSLCLCTLRECDK